MCNFVLAGISPSTNAKTPMRRERSRAPHDAIDLKQYRKVIGKWQFVPVAPQRLKRE